MTTLHRWTRALTVLGVTFALLPGAAVASDHADPTLKPPPPEGGITGLFVFPDPAASQDRLIVILNVRPRLGLTVGEEITDYEYAVHADFDSEILFEPPDSTPYPAALRACDTDPPSLHHDFAENLARYGGTVAKPNEIQEDVRVRFRVTAAVEFEEGYPVFERREGDGWVAIPNTGPITRAVGIYDDPFIFPRFNGSNVVAMAVSVPLRLFNGRQDLLFWGTTSTRKGKLIDHVGRSNRTQLGRFDFLNTLHPSEHYDAICKRYKAGTGLVQGLMHLAGHFAALSGGTGLFQYVLQIRPYDLHPDVMVYSAGRDPGFPNGRRLEDDVAGLTCAQGDCVLQEVASFEGGWPRNTENKPALGDSFPYLGAKLTTPPPPAKPDYCAVIFWSILAALIILWLIWQRRKTVKNETPVVRPYTSR